MSTHSTKPSSNESAKLIAARTKLVAAITQAKPAPVHDSCISTFQPYVDWLRAINEESPSMQSLHLAAAAQRLAFALHHDGHRKDLKALAIWVVHLAMADPEPDQAGRTDTSTDGE